MRLRSIRRIRGGASVLLLATVGALALAGTARAQEPSAQETALARDLFRTGVQAAREARWAEALDAFQRSYAIAPRPMTLLNLAGAQGQSGLLVEASESYRRFLREATDGAAGRQRGAAEQELAALEPRIARLRVDVSGVISTDEVVLDDVPVLEAAIGTDIPVNPGHHELFVLRDGIEIARAEADVEEGGRAELHAELPAAPDPANTAILQADASTPEASHSVIEEPWLWIVVGVVVVGAAVGIGVGVASSSPSPFQGTLGVWEVR